MQVLLNTKKEYTKYIQDSISISIAQKINNYYDDSIKDKIGMIGFQKNLNNIKNWNPNIIENEYKLLIQNSKYKNLDKIYTFTIKTYIKLRLIELNIDYDNYEYPDIKAFIHKCYINAAIWAWKSPFLFFKNNLKQIEIQNNYNIIEINIRKIIKNTLRECVPIDKIICNQNNTNTILNHKIDNDYKEEIKLNETKISKNNFLNNFMNFAKNTIYKESVYVKNNKDLITNTGQLITDKEKSDTQESDKEESDKEESDKEESDKEESDKEESDKEESDKEESDKEESDKEESDKDESDKDESDKEESDKDESDKDESDKEESDKEESDKEESDKEESDKEESDKQESDKEESDKEESDKEESDKEESDKQESDKEESDKEESDKEKKYKNKTKKILINEKKKNKFIIDTSSSEENSDTENINIKKIIW